MKYLIYLLLISIITACSFNNRDEHTSVHTFVYNSDSANSVLVAGSFNGWSSTSDSLHITEPGLWKLEKELEPGYYQYKFIVDGNWIPDPSNPLKINDGGDNFNSIVKVGEPPVPSRATSEREFPTEALPEPVLEDAPYLVNLYYAACEMAWNKIQRGNDKNGFADYYMDEGFNEMIYQWDLCFITGFAMYGRDVFPVMPSLDNFYNKQREDGYIQRVYSETDGSMAAEPTPDEPMVNPPLFAWIEWRYYTISGDSSRFEKVLPVLVKYYDWTAENCRTEKGEGLFYTSMLGSGMDNTPRDNVGKAAWIDYSAQQALAALYISRIAEKTNDEKLHKRFAEEYDFIKSKINKLLWDKDSGFYYDKTEGGPLSPTKHIGAYWTLLSGVCPPDKADKLVAHLENPNEFKRPHMVPTLSADQPEYDPDGHYWLGSVWAPTNYMVVRGLKKYNYNELSDSIAFNHLRNISDIYYNFKPDTNKIAYEERYGDDYHTLWECYSPEYPRPATRWDDTFYSRQDFVGWTGLGPIAILIENVLGFEINGADNNITWTIKRNSRHGIKNIRLKDQIVSLVYDTEDGSPALNVNCEKPFRLSVNYKGETKTIDINKTGVYAL